MGTHTTYKVHPEEGYEIRWPPLVWHDQNDYEVNIQVIDRLCLVDCYILALEKLHPYSGDNLALTFSKANSCAVFSHAQSTNSYLVTIL